MSWDVGRGGRGNTGAPGWGWGPRAAGGGGAQRRRRRSRAGNRAWSFSARARGVGHSRVDRRGGQMVAQPRGLGPGVLGQSELGGWPGLSPWSSASSCAVSRHFAEVSELLLRLFPAWCCVPGLSSDLLEAKHLGTWVCTATPRRPQPSAEPCLDCGTVAEAGATS